MSNSEHWQADLENRSPQIPAMTYERVPKTTTGLGLALKLRLPVCEYFECESIATGGTCELQSGCINFCFKDCGRRLCHFHKTGRDPTSPIRIVDTITCRDCIARMKRIRTIVSAILLTTFMALMIFLLIRMESGI